jgi:hypothetical protein
MVTAENNYKNYFREGPEVPRAIGVNLSHIVLVIRHFVLIFSFSGMILF